MTMVLPDVLPWGFELLAIGSPHEALWYLYSGLGVLTVVRPGGR